MFEDRNSAYLFMLEQENQESESFRSTGNAWVVLRVLSRCEDERERNGIQA